MKTVKPHVLIVTAIIIVFSLLFWVGLLFLAYVADDWASPPADERSVPAKTY
jgi:multisubunit Na+/H+ antiporter MnhC subunit